MLALTLLGGILLGSGDRLGVTVDNLNAGETVSYPIVILRGHTNEQGVRAGLQGEKPLYFPAFQGRYVAFCELRPGKNFVALIAGTESLKMRLDYAPPKPSHRLRTALITRQPVEGEALGKMKSRIDLNLKLLQSYMAETMWEAGLGRKTFQLYTSTDGRVAVDYLPTSAALDPDTVSRALGPGFDMTTQRALVFTDVPASSQAESFRLVDVAPVAYWPSNIGEVARTFANRERTGPLTQLDDLGRGTVWSGYASTLGNTLRHLAIAFGLSPSNDTNTLTGMGYARLNRAFLAYEAPSKDQPDEIPVYPSSAPKWDAEDAKRLEAGPWIE